MAQTQKCFQGEENATDRFFFHILHDEDEGYLNENLVMSQIEHLNCAFEGSEIATCSEEDYEDDYEPSSCPRDYSADVFFKKGLQSLKDFTSNFSIEDLTHRRQTEYGSSTPGSGVNTGISFVLRGITKTNNTDYFRNIDLLETEYKPELRQGDCRTLNIYTGDSGSLGWSYYPDTCIGDMVLDGVILDYKSIAGGMNEYSNEGDALVHVVGHWLGLFHTFQGACEEQNGGDQVADTAPQKWHSFGCPSSKNMCVGGG